MSDFTCHRCRKRKEPSCDDEFSRLCDDCWAAVSMAPEAVAFRERLGDRASKR